MKEKKMVDKPRLYPYSFRLTEKDHKKILELAEGRRGWSKSDALRRMIKEYKI